MSEFFFDDEDVESDSEEEEEGEDKMDVDSNNDAKNEQQEEEEEEEEDATAGQRETASSSLHSVAANEMSGDFFYPYDNSSDYISKTIKKTFVERSLPIELRPAIPDPPFYPLGNIDWLQKSRELMENGVIVYDVMTSDNARRWTDLIIFELSRGPDSPIPLSELNDSDSILNRVRWDGGNPKKGIPPDRINFVAGSFGAIGTVTSYHCHTIRRLIFAIETYVIGFIRALAKYINTAGGSGGGGGYNYVRFHQDRFLVRPYPAKVASETWHTDKSKDGTFVQIAGWLALLRTQKFTYLKGHFPKTQKEFEERDLQSGFSKGIGAGSLNDENYIKKFKSTATILPGQAVAFFSTIVHCVEPTKWDDPGPTAGAGAASAAAAGGKLPMVRQFFGFYLSKNPALYPKSFQDLRYKAAVNQSPLLLGSDIKATQRPQNYIGPSKNEAITREYSKLFRPAVLTSFEAKGNRTEPLPAHPNVALPFDEIGIVPPGHTLYAPRSEWEIRHLGYQSIDSFTMPGRATASSYNSSIGNFPVQRQQQQQHQHQKKSASSSSHYQRNSSGVSSSSSSSSSTASSSSSAYFHPYPRPPPPSPQEKIVHRQSKRLPPFAPPAPANSAAVPGGSGAVAAFRMPRNDVYGKKTTESCGRKGGGGGARTYHHHGRHFKHKSASSGAM